VEALNGPEFLGVRVDESARAEGDTLPTRSEYVQDGGLGLAEHETTVAHRESFRNRPPMIDNVLTRFYHRRAAGHVPDRKRKKGMN
jgi:hypothetical protein